MVSMYSLQLDLVVPHNHTLPVGYRSVTYGSWLRYHSSKILPNSCPYKNLKSPPPEATIFVYDVILDKAHITCLSHDYHMTSLITGGRRFSEGTSADREIQRTLIKVCHHCDVI